MASNHGQYDTREKTTRGIGLYVHPFTEPLRYVEIFTRLHTFGNIDNNETNRSVCARNKSHSPYFCHFSEKISCLRHSVALISPYLVLEISSV